jgi:TIR domain-containing protein
MSALPSKADIRSALCEQVHSALTGPAVGCWGLSGLAAMAGNIFISYRRDESSGMAGRLHDRMAETFGENKLFMDVDNVPVGRDFEAYLHSQVAACDAMMAIIGPKWLDAKDETEQRRLDSPEDFVRVEIAAALARNIPVIPVLIDGARLPKASELPDPLKPLASPGL